MVCGIGKAGRMQWVGGRNCHRDGLWGLFRLHFEDWFMHGMKTGFGFPDFETLENLLLIVYVDGFIAVKFALGLGFKGFVLFVRFGTEKCVNVVSNSINNAILRSRS